MGAYTFGSALQTHQILFRGEKGIHLGTTFGLRITLNEHRRIGTR